MTVLISFHDRRSVTNAKDGPSAYITTEEAMMMKTRSAEWMDDVKSNGMVTESN